jgi:hypothetical protein
LRQRRKLSLKHRIQPHRTERRIIGKVRADFLQSLAPLRKRPVQQIFSVLMQQIKYVIHDRQPRASPVLQLLKIRPPLIIQGHNFAIQYHSPLQGFQRKRHLRKLARVVDPFHRVQQHRVPVHHGDYAVAVLFNFVAPAITFRQLANPQALHRRDESRLRLRIP